MLVYYFKYPILNGFSMTFWLILLQNNDQIFMKLFMRLISTISNYILGKIEVIFWIQKNLELMETPLGGDLQYTNTF